MSDTKSICGFGVAWVGKCKVTPVGGGDATLDTNNINRCPAHSGKKCCSCGDPATHECEETGQFVCGFDLCDRCVHAIFPDGSNGGIGFNAQPIAAPMKFRHVRKDEQVYSPWYSRSSS